MCSYLNSDRPVYAFRRSVPEHLRPYFRTSTGKPRTEWRFSLGTKDRVEAKSRCHLKAVETDNAIAEAQALLDAGKPPPSALSSVLEERRFCAYTGARVGEIAQLRGSDVALVEKIWTLRITPEAGSQKKDEARMVPLHSHLVEQGFPAVAQAAGNAPIFYDPGLSRGGSAANPQFKKVGERLAKWVREIGVTDPNVQPNHGWRHLFKTLGRTHGMEEEARDAFPGHADGSEGRSYGEREMPYLSAQLEKIPRFEV